MLTKVAREAAKKAAAKVRKESGEAGKKRRAAKKKKEEAKKKASKKVASKPKATQKDVRFKKKAELQEGMALDPITGRGVRAASDVDKGKAGKVTRSPEPGFLQSQRTAGSRAKAKEKVELARKVREGEATKADKDKLKRLRQQDELDTVGSTAKGAATRTKRKVDLPPLKSETPKAKPDTRKPRVKTDGTIVNEEAYDKLNKNQQRALIRDAMARSSTPRNREFQALLDELEPTKAGETGVRRRKGGPKGMRGATEKNIKDIDEGVSRGRGGLDFRKGGKVTKRAIGAHDFRMNKGGLLLSSIDNRKKK